MRGDGPEVRGPSGVSFLSTPLACGTSVRVPPLAQPISNHNENKPPQYYDVGRQMPPSMNTSPLLIDTNESAESG